MSEQKIRVMVGNDDGINNIGLDALANSAKSLGNVRIIAPETQQTARAKSMTFHKPIRVTEATTRSGIKGFAYNTAPADSLIIYKHLFEELPEIVLSGINSGDNTSVHSILTSGTAAVAMEAGLMNIPSFAFSMDVPEQFFFSDDFPGELQIVANIAIKIARAFYNQAPDWIWKKILFVNVNFPDEIAEDTPVELVELETHKYNNHLVERIDPKGEKYYWLWGNLRDDFNTSRDSYKLFFDKVITVTPVSMMDSTGVFDECRKILNKYNDS